MSDADIYRQLTVLNDTFFPLEVQTGYLGRNASLTSDAGKLLDKAAFFQAFPEAANLAADNTQILYRRRDEPNVWRIATTNILKGDGTGDEVGDKIAEFNLAPVLTAGSPLRNLYVAIDTLLNYDFSVFNDQQVPDCTAMQAGQPGTFFMKRKVFSLRNATDPIYGQILGSINLLDDADSDVKSTTNFFVLRRILLLLKLAIQHQVLNRSADASTAVLKILEYINTEFVTENSENPNLTDFVKETNATANNYYNKMNDLRDLNTDFSKTRDSVQAVNEIKNVNVQMERVSNRMKIAMVVAAAIALVILILSVSSAMGDQGRQFVLSIQVFAVTMLLAVILYGFTRKRNMEMFINANPSNDSQLAAFYRTYSNVSAVAAAAAAWDQAVGKYLTATMQGGISVQTSDIYTTISDLQKKELQNLAMYNKNISMKHGELEMATKLTEQKEKDNIVFAWLAIGLVVIASLTSAAYALFASVQLLNTIILVAGGVTAAMYALLLLVYIYSRTRRDPSKFYFRAPDYNSYVALAQVEEK